MDEDKPSRGRKIRIVVIAACLLALGACGFSRDGLTTAKGVDTSPLTDGTKADTDLTDSGFTVDTGDTFSDTFDDSDFTDYQISSIRLQERLEKAVLKALPLIRSNVAEKDEIARTLAGERPLVEEPLDPRKPVRLLS